METISFDMLLLKTAFCCMASDGKIDTREIDLIKKMCNESPLFINLNFEETINSFVTQFNTNGKEFISNYNKILNNSQLTEEEELILIDFAVKTIHADGVDEYSEIKFFKTIRCNLKITNEKILMVYPEIESWLEEDINSSSNFENILNQYLAIADFQNFELIPIDISILNSTNE